MTRILIIKKIKQMEKLTSKQKMVLDAVCEFCEQSKGNPTTYRIHKFLEKKELIQAVSSLSFR